MQFHLINTAILMVAREGLRRGCLRLDPSSPRAAARTLRIAALAIPAGAALAAAVTAALLRSAGAAADAAYSRALVMQGAPGRGASLAGVPARAGCVLAF